MDWFPKSVIIHNGGESATELAFDKVVGAPDIIGNGLTQELNWQEVSGARVNVELDLIHSQNDKIVSLSLLPVLKATRYLTTWFLHRSSEYLSMDERPAVLERIASKRSPATLVAQYIASVSLGRCSLLLLLLFRYLGCEDWTSLCVRHPERARTVRVLARNAAAWVNRRVVRRCRKHPFVMGVLGDDKSTDAEKYDVAMAVRTKPKCCIGLGGINIKKMMLADSDILSPEFPAVMWWWAWFISWCISCADIERRNRVSKTIAHKSDKHFK